MESAGGPRPVAQAAARVDPVRSQKSHVRVFVEFLGGTLLNDGADDQCIDIEPQDIGGFMPYQ